MYKAINVIFKEQFDYEWCRVKIKGCKWNDEYSVDIYFYNTFDVCYKTEHVECKKVGTINKRLAKEGYASKMKEV